MIICLRTALRALANLHCLWSIYKTVREKLILGFFVWLLFHMRHRMVCGKSLDPLNHDVHVAAPGFEAEEMLTHHQTLHIVGVAIPVGNSWEVSGESSGDTWMPVLESPYFMAASLNSPVESFSGVLVVISSLQSGSWGKLLMWTWIFHRSMLKTCMVCSLLAPAKHPERW